MKERMKEKKRGTYLSDYTSVYMWFSVALRPQRRVGLLGTGTEWDSIYIKSRREFIMKAPLRREITINLAAQESNSLFIINDWGWGWRMGGVGWGGRQEGGGGG